MDTPKRWFGKGDSFEKQTSQVRIEVSGASFFALFLASWPGGEENLPLMVIFRWMTENSAAETLEKMTWNPPKNGGLEDDVAFQLGDVLDAKAVHFQGRISWIYPNPGCRGKWQMKVLIGISK